MPEPLKSIDIVYYIDFPWHKKYDTRAVKGCRRFFLHAGNAVLRCEENVSLLRPLHIIKSWQRQQRKMGFFTLAMDEFGIKNVHGCIKKIKFTAFNVFSFYTKDTKAQVVTGTFIRHVNDVRQYQFKNRATEQISRLWSTPNHPFYVKNRGVFIPVEEISSEDEMIQKDGQILKMIHSGSHRIHSRIPAEGGVVPVYNLEISGKHTYFVGQDFILVHNPCKIKPKRLQKKPEKLQKKPERIRRISLGERFQAMWDHGFIAPMQDPENERITTLRFQLNREDRETFHSCCGCSRAADSSNARKTDIKEPLTQLGFISMPHLGSSEDGGRVIFWILMDVAQFKRALDKEGAASYAYAESLSHLNFSTPALPFLPPLPFQPPSSMVPSLSSDFQL